MKRINIVIAGPRGNMGKEAVKMVTSTDAFQLVAVVDSKYNKHTLADIGGEAHFAGLKTPIYTDMNQCFTEHAADVLIDLTAPAFGRTHMEIALAHGVRPVVGTTGFTEEDITYLRQETEKRELGAIIAPNFAIGAILMMKFSQMAAKHFTDVEIIESHHDRKLDAPSGTAIKTAEMIAEVRKQKVQGHPDEKEELAHARGADYEGMRIHSVRLPGLVAHQEVTFGGLGQTFSIRHDSIDRTSFMPGIKLAVETVLQLDTLVYGLEHIIE